MTRGTARRSAMGLVLDLVRHGEASPAGAGGDAARTLSGPGVLAVSRLAERLIAEGPPPDRVFASPLVRAQQTARILTMDWNGAPATETLGCLLPESEPEEVLAGLAAHGVKRGHVIVVAHLPLLDRLADAVTGCDCSFAPASLVRITFPAAPEPGLGELTLQIHPAG